MATIGSLVVRLSAQTAQFDRQITASQKAITAFGRMAAGLGVYFGGREIIRWGGAAIGAFMEAEAASSRLGAALSLLGPKAAAGAAELEKFATALMQQTTLDDEAIKGIMALGASIGRMSGETLQKATIAAIGLSRALGIDTEAAMLLVSKAAAGNTSQLGRYGIVLSSTLTPQQKFNELLKIGAAAFTMETAAVQTLTGQVQQLKNSWGEVKEAVGGAIMEWAKAIDLTEGLQAIADLLKHGTVWQPPPRPKPTWAMPVDTTAGANMDVSIAKAKSEALAAEFASIKTAVDALISQGQTPIQKLIQDGNLLGKAFDKGVISAETFRKELNRLTAEFDKPQMEAAANRMEALTTAADAMYREWSILSGLFTEKQWQMVDFEKMGANKEQLAWLSEMIDQIAELKSGSGIQEAFRPGEAIAISKQMDIRGMMTPAIDPIQNAQLAEQKKSNALLNDIKNKGGVK